MIKIKDSDEITSYLFGKTFLDLDPEEENEDLGPSEYIFYVKDMSNVPSHEDTYNKLALIIISSNDNYVVNNNFMINSVWIDGNKITFRYIHGKKHKIATSIYYHKK